MATTPPALPLRIGIAAGALVCILLTPGFVLSHFEAYRNAEGAEAPPWLVSLNWPEVFSGSDAFATDDAYGVAWGLTLAAIVAMLVLLFRKVPPQTTRVRRGWTILIAGFGAVAVGALIDYGISDDTHSGGVGFVLELAGFATIAVAAVVLVGAARREASLDMRTTGALGLLGIGSVAVAALAFVQIPSGLAFVPLIALAVSVLRGHPNDGVDAT